MLSLFRPILQSQLKRPNSNQRQRKKNINTYHIHGQSARIGQPHKHPTAKVLVIERRPRANHAGLATNCVVHRDRYHPERWFEMPARSVECYRTKTGTSQTSEKYITFHERENCSTTRPKWNECTMFTCV